MDADDAEQIGVIGLIKAARRFDPDLGFQFSTFATRVVRQACQRLGPEAALLVRLPANVIESLRPIRRHLDGLRTASGPGRVNDERYGLVCERSFLTRVLAIRHANSRETQSGRRTFRRPDPDARRVAIAAGSISNATKRRRTMSRMPLADRVHSTKWPSSTPSRALRSELGSARYAMVATVAVELRVLAG